MTDRIADIRARYQRGVEYWSANRTLQKEDLRFAYGDSDNGYQWPDKIKRDRESSSRPTLTINKLPLHINQVINDIRQNTPAIKVRPVDDAADIDTAEVFNGIVRHIESRSDADMAYVTAAEHQTIHGEGFVRILTEYESDESFDQDILIGRVRNPFRVIMDPDAQVSTGADARWWFVIDEMPEDDFKAEHPKATAIDWETLARDSGMRDWFKDKRVVVAEYIYLERQEKTLSLLPDGTQTSEKVEGAVNTRKVVVNQWRWCKLNGKEILDERDLPGKYAPIVRVVGNEIDVDGKVMVSGMVRNAKDAQRMYNFWVSQEAEFLARSNKAPYIGAAGQFEGYEAQWQTANTASHAYLEYNPVSEGGQPLPPPQRVQPPVPPAGIIQAKIGAADDIKATTGQFDASLGQRSNETSGRAILARQREGDTATAHYPDNLAKAVRQVGRVLIDLIPKIYDTPRVARILGEDGETDHAELDPSLPQAMAKIEENGKVKTIYNLNVGKYDVVATAGPSFNTKRVEGAQMMTEVLQGNPALMQVIGDIYFRSLDVPYADELSKRLKLMLPPNIAQAEGAEEGQEIPPQAQAVIQQQQAQLEQIGTNLEAAVQAIHERDQALEQAKMEGANRQVDAQAKVDEATIKAQAEMAKAAADVEIARIQAAAAAPEGQQNQIRELVEGLAQMMKPESEPQLEVVQQMLAQVADTQALLANQLEQVRAENERIAQVAAAPRRSTITVTKTADGKYVGEKVETPVETAQ